jgi:hypothetical protein
MQVNDRGLVEVLIRVSLEKLSKPMTIFNAE